MPRISIERRSRIHALIYKVYPSRYIAKKGNMSQSEMNEMQSVYLHL
ncbi:8934_t:CDS:2 [Gigaspora margarita]|uniref:8934_t:CDS:1 n=1 Tax=Gigaspora margarita TaxID=4874 RepID=A0ABN7UI42_GIGMA|nr:8934_t:CDS:2 [Gigaspora margarita]